jgi:hypothetical protein
VGKGEEGLHTNFLDVVNGELRFALRMADIVLFAQVLLDGALALAYKWLATLACQDAASIPQVDGEVWNGWSIERRQSLSRISGLQRVGLYQCCTQSLAFDPMQ